MPDRIGGAEGDRTPDLMTASHALSQLSYGPLSGLSITVRSTAIEGEKYELLFIGRFARVARVENSVKQARLRECP